MHKSHFIIKAKAVRREVESKLPDGVLCQQASNETNIDMIAVRNKAESILNNLAKHLVALKASENRLDKAARRSYLQVSYFFSWKFDHTSNT